jgi:hypothetical protein
LLRSLQEILPSKKYGSTHFFQGWQTTRNDLKRNMPRSLLLGKMVCDQQAS